MNCFQVQHNAEAKSEASEQVVRWYVEACADFKSIVRHDIKDRGFDGGFLRDGLEGVSDDGFVKFAE